MAKKETAVATTNNNFSLPAINGNIAQAMAEEMDGLTLSFPRARIPAGGATSFEVPGDDPESPETAKEIVGVIVDHHPVNAFWPGRYAGGNNPPECSSMDGKVGADLNGNRVSCSSCPRNQWGSGPDGRGKACKNMHRVYILREGEALPLLLTLPPTSLKNFSDYVGLRIVTRGLRTHSVVTKIALKKAQNADGISYSQVVFALAERLAPKQAQAMAEYSQGIKVLTRQLAVQADEYIQPEEVGYSAPAQDANEEDEIPF